MGGGAGYASAIFFGWQCCICFAIELAGYSAACFRKNACEVCGRGKELSAKRSMWGFEYSINGASKVF